MNRNSLVATPHPRRANGTRSEAHDSMTPRESSPRLPPTTPPPPPPPPRPPPPQPPRAHKVCALTQQIFSRPPTYSPHQVLLPILSRLPLRDNEEDQPILFACENDHDAVARLKKDLEGRVRVVDCMVDRVCTGRIVTPDAVSNAYRNVCGPGGRMVTTLPIDPAVVWAPPCP